MCLSQRNPHHRTKGRSVVRPSSKADEKKRWEHKPVHWHGCPRWQAVKQEYQSQNNRTRVSSVCKCRVKMRVRWLGSLLFPPASGYTHFPLALPCSAAAVSALLRLPRTPRVFQDFNRFSPDLQGQDLLFLFPSSSSLLLSNPPASYPEAIPEHYPEINLPCFTVKSAENNKQQDISELRVCFYYYFYLVLLFCRLN